ncbi:MAG: hypothetical protein K6G78_01600 [bacterium]|nr:hypothetical protein [bacterium]
MGKHSKKDKSSGAITMRPYAQKRDLSKPSKSSVIGVMSIKGAIAVILAIFLVLYSLGLSGQEPLAGALSLKMILCDLAAGLTVACLLTAFTFAYVKAEQNIVGGMAFVVLVLLIIGVLAIWNAVAANGGSIAFIVVGIVLGLLSLGYDLYTFPRRKH